MVADGLDTPHAKPKQKTANQLTTNTASRVGRNAFNAAPEGVTTFGAGRGGVRANHQLRVVGQHQLNESKS